MPSPKTNLSILKKQWNKKYPHTPYDGSIFQDRHEGFVLAAMDEVRNQGKRNKIVHIFKPANPWSPLHS